MATPPMPEDGWEAKRWDHTRLRRRMLYGAWEGDLRQRLAEAIGHVRTEAYGKPDTSSCVLTQVATELACLYDVAPSVRREDGDMAASEALTAVLRDSGWSSIMQRVQRDALGLREMLIHVSVSGTEDDPVVVLRPVFPDLVVATASPVDPTNPAMIKEARLRGDKWTWDVLDIRDPTAPRYQVLDAETDHDVSAEYLGVEGGLTGDAYPYRDAEGRPVLPYVLYHASRGPELWDPFEWEGLVTGSLEAGVRWSLCVSDQQPTPCHPDPTALTA